MATPRNTVQMMEMSRVAPPLGSVAETSLSLTLFDVFWHSIPPVKRIFFFQLSDPKTNFFTSLLPNLKQSLSLTLQHFYPLAGTLTLSPQTGQMEIRYVQGDSVQFTVAESDADFHGLLADHPKETAQFHPLVPELPDSDLLSLQLTVFPNSGISLGLSVHHAATDGTSTMHFIRHWASTFRFRDCSSSISPLPLCDRALIPDLNGLARIFQDQKSIFQQKVSTFFARAPEINMVRATFVLSRAHIERLRQRLARTRMHVGGENEKPTWSSFVLTCAYVWVCLARAQGDSGRKSKSAHFGFAVDCRARMDPPIPGTYFGNCIGACVASAKASDLAKGDDEEGFLAACEAIRREIQQLDMEDYGPMAGADGWIPKIMSIAVAGESFFSVAGSPRIRVYDVDFGFGRPRKVEVISIEETGAMSLAERHGREAGDEGFEVGLALPKCVMERFSLLYEQGLKV